MRSLIFEKLIRNSVYWRRLKGGGREILKLINSANFVVLRHSVAIFAVGCGHPRELVVFCWEGSEQS